MDEMKPGPWVHIDGSPAPTCEHSPEVNRAWRSFQMTRVRLLVEAWLRANHLEATKPATEALVEEIGKIVAR